MSISEPEPRPVVLVVEDDTLVRLFTSDFLDEAGFKVFEAVNALREGSDSICFGRPG